MAKSREQWLPLLYRALEEEIGIAFTVTGCTAQYFRGELHIARKQAADPQLDELMFFTPANGELWICKKSVELDD